MNIFVTDDGSHSVVSEQFGATYHSRHGAIQETQVVFIEAGLKYLIEKGYESISILEIGFGTGLNALMTFLESQNRPLYIQYTTLEAYPLSMGGILQLNYPHLLNAPEVADVFLKMHNSDWNTETLLSPSFSFKKLKTDFLSLDVLDSFDLVYFDAFSPEVQPELWTETMFTKVT